jgi:hypothetical protein
LQRKRKKQGAETAKDAVAIEVSPLRPRQFIRSLF